MTGKALLTLAVATIATVGGCATTAAHPTSMPEPTPCRDSLYLDLRRHAPDSLSSREWERFRALDRECSAARSHDAEARRGMPRGGMMGMGHSTEGWTVRGLLAITLMVVIMAVVR